MLNASISKKNCSDLESLKAAKKLSQETVKKLIELENSGANIDPNIKCRVLEHDASYYALENQWQKNYKALLEIERMNLKVSPQLAVELQMLIGRAENYVSACNFKLALKRQKNALKLARAIKPLNPQLLVRVLQHLAALLNKEGKVDEARPFAEEIVQICKTMPAESGDYIRAMTSALEMLSEFDRQTSKDMLMNILKERWPQVHKCVINSCVETSSIIREDTGDAEYLAGLLEALLICISKGLDANEPVRGTGAEHKKVMEYLTIGKIVLEIRTNFYGPIHPMLTIVYLNLCEAYTLLRNEAKAKECFRLCEQCKDTKMTDTTQFCQGVPPADNNMYRARTLKNKGKSFFKKQDYCSAVGAYTEALSVSPNDAKVLTKRAAAYLNLSERQSLPENKPKFLLLALADSEKAITEDPSWMKGFYWRAVCLAHLDRRGASLAAAAVACHLFPSSCTNISTVEHRFECFDLQVVHTSQDFKKVTGTRTIQSLVILVKEGRYQLQEPLTIPEGAVMVGLGDVEINCAYGVPLKYSETFYLENITLSPTAEFIQTIKEEAKVCLDRGRVDEALALYDKALATCPNNPKILTSKALAFLKSAQQQKDIPSKRESSLQLGLNDAEAAIKADRCWLLGYRTKAMILLELGRKPEALAATAVFKHLSLGRDVSEVTKHCGELQVHVVESSDQLRCVFEKVKQLERKNQAILVKGGEYLLERSVDISEEIVIVGHGKVSVACKTGAPFHFTTACHVENVEMAKDYGRQEEPEDHSTNDTEPEVIRLAMPSGHENTSNECKVN